MLIFILKKYNRTLFFSCLMIISNPIIGMRTPTEYEEKRKIFGVGFVSSVEHSPEKHSRLSPYIHPINAMNVFTPKRGKEDELLKAIIGATFLWDPSHNSIIMGTQGAVYSIPVGNNSQNTAEKLFQHPKVKHPPIMDIVKQGDGKYMIASAGNRFAKSKGTYSSQLKIYNKQGWGKEINLDWAVQDLKFSEDGEYLVIGSPTSIALFNIKQESFATIPFDPAVRESILTNIALCPRAAFLLATSADGQSQFIPINKIKNTLSKLSTTYSIKTTDKHQEGFSTQSKIKQFFCPSSDVFVFSSAYTVQAASVYAFTGAGDGSGTVPVTTIAKSKHYNRATFNRKLETLAVALWSSKDKSSENHRHKIKVFFIKKQTTEPAAEYVFAHTKYTLKVPLYLPHYNMMAPNGRVAVFPERILNIAFYGTFLAALLSTGKILVYKIPLGETPTDNLEVVTTTATTTSAIHSPFPSQASSVNQSPENIRANNPKAKVKGAQSDFLSRQPLKPLIPTTGSSPNLTQLKGSHDSARESRKKGVTQRKRHSGSPLTHHKQRLSVLHSAPSSPRPQDNESKEPKKNDPDDSK